MKGCYGQGGCNGHIVEEFKEKVHEEWEVLQASIDWGIYIMVSSGNMPIKSPKILRQQQ